MYMAFLPALLPLLVTRLGLTLVSAGLLASVVSLTSQLSQPVFGHLSDRLGPRPLVILGPLVTTLSMSCLGLVSSYGALLAVAILGSLGTAAIHPAAAALVGRIARAGGGAAMAIFTAGGNIGFGLGPPLVIAVVNAFDLRASWLTAAVGLAVVLYVARSLGRNTAGRDGGALAPLGPTRPWLAALAVLYLVVMLRAAAAAAFTTFVPMLIERRGAALMLGGWALLGFSLAGAVGGLVGGPLSDRVGRKWVTVTSLALSGPAFYGFLHADGLASAALLLATGACLFAALPVNIVSGQELLPGRASTVSGVVMGFAWGIGGLSATVVGAFADRLTVALGPAPALARALSLAAAIPIAAAAIALALPETRRRAHP